MPPIISTCGLYRREVSSALEMEALSGMPVLMIPKAASSFDPKTSTNKEAAAASAAVALTQSRVDYLWSVYSDAAFISQDTLYVIWQINASRREFNKEWLDIVINKGLIDTNFPKLAVDGYLKRIAAVDISTCGDDLTYRWVENLFGILIGFSDWSEAFKDALSEADVLPPLIAYLSNSAQVLAEARADIKKASLLEFVLKLMFNLSRSGDIMPDYARTVEPYFTPQLPDADSNKNVSLIAAMCSARIDSLWPELSSLDASLLQVFLDYYATALTNENRHYRGIGTYELSECLRRLAITDADKELLIRKEILRTFVRPLLYSTDAVEQRQGVDMLYALCSSATNDCSGPCLAVIEDNEDCIQPLQWLAVKGETADLKHHTKRFLEFLNDRVAILTGKLYAKLRSPGKATKPELTRGVLGTSLVLKEKPTVYISFFKREAQIAKQIKRLLIGGGLKVVNSDALIPDKVVDITNIEQGLAKADTVAICYSEAYYLSLECRRELELAASYQKKFFSIRVDPQFDSPADGWLSQFIGPRCLLNVENDDALQQSDVFKQLASRLATEM